MTALRPVLLFVLLQIFFVSSAQAKGEKPLLPETLKGFQACDHASDCVRVNNGCCDCANGGETVAIHRKFEKKLRDLFPCEKVMCSQRAGDCMFREPACEKGLCVLVDQSATKKFPTPPKK